MADFFKAKQLVSAQSELLYLASIPHDVRPQFKILLAIDKILLAIDKILLAIDKILLAIDKCKAFLHYVIFFVAPVKHYVGSDLESFTCKCHEQQ